MPLALFFGMGVVFGFLAGLIAFLITYQEWQKHKFAGRKLWKEALRAGTFAFGVFLVVSVVSGFLMINFVIQR